MPGKETNNTVAVAAIWLCQATTLTCSLLVTSIAGAVGTTLAPAFALGTLPYSLFLVGTTLGMFPAFRIMMKVGRRLALIVGAGFGSAGGAVSLLAIGCSSFVLFSIGAFLLGTALAFTTFYRFAAVQLVAPTRQAHVHSAFVAGGLVASLAGPALASHTPFASSHLPQFGSYLMVAVLFLGTAVVMALIKRPEWTAAGTRSPFGAGHRPVQMGSRVLVLGTAANAVAAASMTALMVALPITHHSHALAHVDTSLILQMHFLGMYLPGIVTGPLVNRLGIRPSIAAGGVMGLLGAVAGMAGNSSAHLIVALVASGVSWALIAVASATAISRASQPAMETRLGFYVSLSTALVSLSIAGAIEVIGWLGVNACVAVLFVGLFALIAWSGRSQRDALPEPV
ncbi:MAG: hypothetical protein WDO68_02090 [Gammaproteobacteria bacterium]